MSEIQNLIGRLNAASREERLDALRRLYQLEKQGELAAPVKSGFVNNHIHTTYSFSPYSPSMALWKAREAGLDTAGIMDHDSVGGCVEFIEAGEILGMAVTCGFECRVDVSGTALEGRRINNPDQNSIAYVALHGIPHQNIAACESFLSSFRENRNKRNRAMTRRINGLMEPHGIALDFDADIAPLSMCHDGGSVTERHLLYALSRKIISAFGKGRPVAEFVKNTLKLSISAKAEEFLTDSGNPHYEYDLLGVLKSDLVNEFYIPATDELPHITDFIALAQKTGGISAYAYLGDVGDSVTGDKKTQKFEDDYIELLFDELERLGFDAVTYMPSRNTIPQLLRVIDLAAKHRLFEISGEDINTSRQSFICQALAKPEFRHLYSSTWALIGHEKAATADPARGMFTAETKKRYPSLAERIRAYEILGKE